MFFLVPHLDARDITVEVVLPGLFNQPIKFIVALQSAVVHTVLAQDISLLVYCMHKVYIVLHPFVDLRVDIQVPKESHRAIRLTRGGIALSVET